jgi:hypothetical protein
MVLRNSLSKKAQEERSKQTFMACLRYAFFNAVSSASAETPNYSSTGQSSTTLDEKPIHQIIVFSFHRGHNLEKE